jgi:ADP-heptose:LPS heptosyltransferase
LNLLLIRSGALGDTLMALPALAELKGKVTTALAGRQPGLYFARDMVHSALDMEGPGWHRIFAPQGETVSLPVSGFDIAVAFFSRDAGAVQRNLESALPGTSVHVFASFPLKQDTHAALHVAACLKEAGLPLNPEEALKRARKQTLLKGPKDLERPGTILFHPGSGDSEKNFPARFWISLARELCEEKPLQGRMPVFLLGPAEEHLRQEPFLEGPLSNGRLIFCPEKDELQTLLSTADLYLGHDSGITHLAAMLGVATVALFRKTDPRQWGPLGPAVRILEGREYSRKGLVKEVIKAATSLLG